MATPSTPTLERQLAAAQAWWREAGVEHVFTDEPQAWLPQVEPDVPAADRALQAQVLPAAEAPPSMGGPRESWPGDLASFSNWWLAEPSLDFGSPGARVPPRGVVEPRLLVLVPMPEAEDRETLLAGRQGPLVAGMLASMGIEPEAAYLASALPCHVNQPDWAALAQAGLGEIVRHHLALARPQRLLVLGHGILPLLGNDLPQAAAAVKQISIHGAADPVAVPTLVGFALDRLLENTRQRALLWRQWLEWTDAG